MTKASTHADFDLRPATAGDQSAVLNLLEQNDLPVSGVPDSLEHFFIAESSGRAVGTIGLERYGSFGLLRSAAVAPDQQGRGIGRALVERLLAYSRDLGLDTVYLLTTTAEGYFPSFGFMATRRESVPAEVQESEQFTSLCPSSAAVLELRLREGAGRM